MLAFLKSNYSRSEKALLALFVFAICQQTIFIYPVAILKSVAGIIGGLILPMAYLILTLVVLFE
jgi:hypothetical protein